MSQGGEPSLEPSDLLARLRMSFPAIPESDIKAVMLHNQGTMAGCLADLSQMASRTNPLFTTPPPPPSSYQPFPPLPRPSQPPPTNQRPSNLPMGGSYVVRKSDPRSQSPFVSSPTQSPHSTPRVQSPLVGGIPRPHVPSSGPSVSAQSPSRPSVAGSSRPSQGVGGPGGLTLRMPGGGSTIMFAGGGTSSPSITLSTSTASPILNPLHINTKDYPLDRSSQVSTPALGESAGSPGIPRARQISIRLGGVSPQLSIGVPGSGAGGFSLEERLGMQRSRREAMKTRLGEVRERRNELAGDVEEMEEQMVARRKASISQPTNQTVTALHQETRKLQSEVNALMKQLNSAQEKRKQMTLARLQIPPVAYRQQGQAGAQPGGSESLENSGEERWNCSACTYLNHPALWWCEMCEMPRVGAHINQEGDSNFASSTGSGNRKTSFRCYCCEGGAHVEGRAQKDSREVRASSSGSALNALLPPNWLPVTRGYERLPSNANG